MEDNNQYPPSQNTEDFSVMPSSGLIPAKLPKRNFLAAIGGIAALFLFVTLAGATFFVSNQLSTRLGLAPNAPLSEPEAQSCTKLKEGKCGAAGGCLSGFICGKVGANYTCTKSTSCTGTSTPNPINTSNQTNTLTPYKCTGQCNAKCENQPCGNGTICRRCPLNSESFVCRKEPCNIQQDNTTGIQTYNYNLIAAGSNTQACGIGLNCSYENLGGSTPCANTNGLQIYCCPNNQIISSGKCVVAQTSTESNQITQIPTNINTESLIATPPNTNNPIQNTSETQTPSPQCIKSGEPFSSSISCCPSLVKVVTPYGTICGVKGNECTEGAKKCQVGANDTYFEYKCDSSGYYQQDKRCDFGCKGNTCQTQGCNPDEKKCDNNMLKTCNIDGSVWKAEYCPNGCDNTNKICKPTPTEYCSNHQLIDCSGGCKPTTTGGTCITITPFCSSENLNNCKNLCTPSLGGGSCPASTRTTCDGKPNGTSECTVNHDSFNYCNDGIWTNIKCAPGYTCPTGNTICQKITQCENGMDLISLKCSDDEKSMIYCDSNGKNISVDCNPNMYCPKNNNMCINKPSTIQICEPNKDRCLTILSISRHQKCNSDGTEWNQVDEGCPYGCDGDLCKEQTIPTSTPQTGTYCTASRDAVCTFKIFGPICTPCEGKCTGPLFNVSCEPTPTVTLLSQTQTNTLCTPNENRCGLFLIFIKYSQKCSADGTRWNFEETCWNRCDTNTGKCIQKPNTISESPSTSETLTATPTPTSTATEGITPSLTQTPLPSATLTPMIILPTLTLPDQLLDPTNTQNYNKDAFGDITNYFAGILYTCQQNNPNGKKEDIYNCFCNNTNCGNKIAKEISNRIVNYSDSDTLYQCVQFLELMEYSKPQGNNQPIASACAASSANSLATCTEPKYANQYFCPKTTISNKGFNKSDVLVWTNSSAGHTAICTEVKTDGSCSVWQSNLYRDGKISSIVINKNDPNLEGLNFAGVWRYFNTSTEAKNNGCH